ncbi:MAG: glycerol-3-phosphate dehydrogenase [Pseudomonadales bacterium]|nr:glycerol-3-phosphate dehydrogenase [Pseudomonadales bacterium]
MSEQDKVHDLLVVGGGINGTGIAADAAGRGLDVVLCEMNDLASATSSSSTKLIHGGLRYLEQYEFRLVREALAEREVLLRNAPHIIWPMRFQLPHRKHLRPRWMIRIGLFLYDSLSKRVSLPASRGLRFGADSPLLPELRHGFEYSDAWVDDARLVVLNAMQARARGAEILVRTRCVALTAEAGIWTAVLESATGQTSVRARAVVNAAGPWVERFAGSVLAENQSNPVRLVKGCHIVVPRMFPGDEAYMLQNDDGRVVFVIPYEQDFTLIGTTEEDYKDDPALARISDWEVDYLINLVNSCFRQKINRDSVVHDFAGVRPLIGDEGTANASKVSRDYTLVLNTTKAPLLTVYGGKITTYRKLAEAVMHKLRIIFPQMTGDWTATAKLPGGNFVSKAELAAELRKRVPWLPEAILQRWLRQYGSCTLEFLAGVSSLEDLGEDFGHGLHAIEVNYLQSREWAQTAEDILWRRTKLGLHFTQQEEERLADWLSSRTTDTHIS